MKFIVLLFLLPSLSFASLFTGETAQEIVSSSPHTSLDDPRYTIQWYLHDYKEKKGISLKRGLDQYGALEENEVIVAVVDTGVSYIHPDLENKMWINKAEIPHNGIDDDLNGFVDDIYGIDLIANDGDPMDTGNHGTHIAGIIAQIQNNSIGGVGISRKAKIMAIRAVPNRGDEKDDAVIKSFYYAASNGAKIINCSFGRYEEIQPKLLAAINDIGKNYGVLFFAGAGNDRKNIDKKSFIPATLPSPYIVTVGAMNKRGRLWRKSNYGKNEVDLMAPGEAIASLIAERKYATISGTSMATAVVSAIAATIISHRPKLRPLELKKTLIKSTRQMRSLRTRSISSGVADYYLALDYLYSN